MAKRVNTYKPRDTRIEAMRFYQTEPGIIAMKKWAGPIFAAQAVGASTPYKSVRYLLYTDRGWVPVNSGDYVCKENGRFFRLPEAEFKRRFEMCNEEEAEENHSVSNKNRTKIDA